MVSLQKYIKHKGVFILKKYIFFKIKVHHMSKTVLLRKLFYFSRKSGYFESLLGSALVSSLVSFIALSYHLYCFQPQLWNSSNIMLWRNNLHVSLLFLLIILFFSPFKFYIYFMNLFHFLLCFNFFCVLIIKFINNLSLWFFLPAFIF